MSKIRLVDVETRKQEMVFGTCDYCFHSDFMDVTSYEFEHEDGTHEVIPGAEVVDWGTFLFELPDFNVTRFAGWLDKQEFPRDYRIWSTQELDKLVTWFIASTRGNE